MAESVNRTTTENSLEDILAKAQWVTSVIDPSLCVDQLQDIFTEVIFSFPAEDHVERDAQERGPRIRTAAEKRKEEERKRELREGLRELKEGPLDSETDEDGDSFIVDQDDYDESYDEAEQEKKEADEDFLDWIFVGHHAPMDEARGAAIEDAERKDVELEMRRVGLGVEQEQIATDELPDRFREIVQREGRPHLGPKTLAGGYSYELPLESEAYWILRQLRNTGQPLAHNSRIRSLASNPLSSIVDKPVMVSLVYALKKMTREFVEPAHLMMYHQTHLHPLLFALLEDSSLQKEGEHSMPMTSYAYSTLTGSRQRPYLRENDIGFNTLAVRPIGSVESRWQSIDERYHFTQRKPCFIELGRLLVRILELDTLCHQLEYRRHQMLLMLESCTEAQAQKQRIILENTVFESTIDVNIWHAFVQTLVSRGQSRSAYRRVQELGLQEAYEEYSLTGLQYQENLMNGRPLSLCSSPKMHLRDWAEQVSRRVSQAVSPEFIISLFNNAIMDQFSKLPLLCRKVMELFTTMGHLIVSHNWTKQPDDIYPISTFFVEHPQHYLELLQLEARGTVNLHYVLDENLIRQELREDELYHVRPSADKDGAEIEEEWYRERQSAFSGLVVKLMDTLVPRLKAELRQQARYHTTRDSVERLGSFCSMGPYELTRLALSTFSSDLLLWEPEWNVVEALPTSNSPSGPRIQARVCGVSRGDNGVLTFAFIDEMGVLIQKTRWAETNMSTDIGRAANKSNQVQLQKMFQVCNPSVVAVAANGIEALDVMLRVQRFLKEYVYEQLLVRIPVVWAAAEVARFFSESHFADLEMPRVDMGLRQSVGLARFVQDPLQVIATLFDSKKTALQLFSTPSQCTTREHQRELFEALCWEMSLWVGSTGFWLDDCVRRPNSIAVLQFVPGLGFSKASLLHRRINEHRPMDRVSLTRMLTEDLSPLVARNASPCIRVPPNSKVEEMLDSEWHPLDQTLIPLEMYDVATRTASIASKKEQETNKKLLSLHLIDFLSTHVMKRREAVHMEVGNGEDILEDIRKEQVRGYESVFGNREMEFIADELVANGASFMRRPYRRMTTKGLLLSVAGLAYFTKSEVPFHKRFMLQSSAEGDVIQEGSYVSGTIDGFRSGRFPGIRIITSRGLRAFLPADEIDEESMRSAVLGHIHHLENIRRVDAENHAREEEYTVPEWLQRDAIIQGTVLRCQWSRCELLLHWCPPQLEANTERVGEDQRYISYADAVKDGAASSANSIRTAQIEEDATIFSSKISVHPLFRDIGDAEAMNMLRDKEIGEVLFRPSSRRRSKSICMVKLGSVATCNVVISEDRRSDGAIYYRLHDTVTTEQREFNDIDEFHRNYINSMVQLVRNLRSHRRFVESVHDVSASLSAQQKGTERFAYVFVENTKNFKPPYYRVYTRGGGKEHRFHLHFTDKNIFVCLPFPTSGGKVFLWTACQNAEELSWAIKNHALRSS